MNVENSKRLNSINSDLTELRKPMKTNFPIIKKLAKLLDAGNREMTDILTQEVILLYKCRSCRAIFATFKHFLSHKIFCKGTVNAYCEHEVTDNVVNQENPTFEAFRRSKQNNSALYYNNKKLNKLICKICSETFTSQETFNSHIEIEHATVPSKIVIIENTKAQETQMNVENFGNNIDSQDSLNFRGFPKIDSVINGLIRENEPQMENDSLLQNVNNATGFIQQQFSPLENVQCNGFAISGVSSLSEEMWRKLPVSCGLMTDISQVNEEVVDALCHNNSTNTEESCAERSGSTNLILAKGLQIENRELDYSPVNNFSQDLISKEIQSQSSLGNTISKEGDSIVDDLAKKDQIQRPESHAKAEVEETAKKRGRGRPKKINKKGDLVKSGKEPLGKNNCDGNEGSVAAQIEAVSGKNCLVSEKEDKACDNGSQRGENLGEKSSRSIRSIIEDVQNAFNSDLDDYTFDNSNSMNSNSEKPAVDSSKRQELIKPLNHELLRCVSCGDQFNEKMDILNHLDNCFGPSDADLIDEIESELDETLAKNISFQQIENRTNFQPQCFNVIDSSDDDLVHDKERTKRTSRKRKIASRGSRSRSRTPKRNFVQHNNRSSSRLSQKSNSDDSDEITRELFSGLEKLETERSISRASRASDSQKFSSSQQANSDPPNTGTRSSSRLSQKLNYDEEDDITREFLFGDVKLEIDRSSSRASSRNSFVSERQTPLKNSRLKLENYDGYSPGLWNADLNSELRRGESRNVKTKNSAASFNGFRRQTRSCSRLSEKIDYEEDEITRELWSEEDNTRGKGSTSRDLKFHSRIKDRPKSCPIKGVKEMGKSVRRRGRPRKNDSLPEVKNSGEETGRKSVMKRGRGRPRKELSNSGNAGVDKRLRGKAFSAGSSPTVATSRDGVQNVPFNSNYNLNSLLFL